MHSSLLAPCWWISWPCISIWRSMPSGIPTFGVPGNSQSVCCDPGQDPRALVRRTWDKEWGDVGAPHRRHPCPGGRGERHLAGGWRTGFGVPCHSRSTLACAVLLRRPAAAHRHVRPVAPAGARPIARSLRTRAPVCGLVLPVAALGLRTADHRLVRSKVRVQARMQSPSIVEITFPNGSRPGMFGRISRSILSDWRAFAVVSGETTAGAHKMLISPTAF